MARGARPGRRRGPRLAPERLAGARARARRPEGGGLSTTVSPALLEQLVDLLAERLAPRLADELAARLEAPAAAQNGLGTARLVALDELVAELPRSKPPQTWKRWLYERLRRDEVPGAVKLGGSWFFDVERLRPWLEGEQLASDRRK